MSDRQYSSQDTCTMSVFEVEIQVSRGQHQHCRVPSRGGARWWPALCTGNHHRSAPHSANHDKPC
ncbi:hypothetical protein JB92DRAFT_3074333, partial [Gautieria morchelliformis]